MRCPHCGSPVPLGSSMCIDCGAKLNVKEWNPWDENDRSSARRTTGEREYRRNNARQSRHERQHTAHSTSGEASRDFESERHSDDAVRYTSPRPAQYAKPEKQKKKGGAGLAATVIAVLGLLSAIGPGLLDHFESWTDDDSGYEEDTKGFSFDFDSDDYVDDTEEETVYNDDGSYQESHYDSDGTIDHVYNYGADDVLDSVERYDDSGELYNVDYYDDWGNVESSEYFTDGDLYETDIYTYYDDDTLQSEQWIAEDGTVLFEEYYDEESNVTGYVSRDEDTGEVLDVFGIDADGNDLEELYPID